MESKEPETFQKDYEKVANAVTALKQEKCLTGQILEECEANLAYLNNYLESSYKFTFLIDGEAQTGKTTFLNCLLDDDIVTGLKGNYMIIVQYDKDCREPELFISNLPEIFNSQKEIFIIKPENMKKTGVKGRGHIQSALKEFIKKDSQEPGSDSDAQQQQRQIDQPVYIIKYKIDWLADMIQDEFILNRIQFLDINKSAVTKAQFENIMIFQSIMSSKDHSQLFVADGQRLFTGNISDKFQQFKQKKDRSLIVINRSDTLGTKEHFKKINKNQSALASRLNTTFEDLQEMIENIEETDNERREIFYQAFMENQNIEQKEANPEEILFFTCALYNISRVLLQKYQMASCDGEKAALNDLFVDRNKTSTKFKTNKRRAAQKEVSVMQYYIESGDCDEYLMNNSISHIRKAISEISKAKFTRLKNELPEKLHKVRAKITNPDYLPKCLSETEVQELTDFMENHMKVVFAKREERIIEKIQEFYKVIMQQLQNFNISVRNINPENPDFFVIKNSHKPKLDQVFEAFKSNWKASETNFTKEIKDIETDYTKEIAGLLKEVESKKHIHNYVKNNVELQDKKILKIHQKITESLVELAKASLIKIVDFVTGSNFFRQVSSFVAKLFGKRDHQCLDFPCLIKCSTENFFDVCEEMRKGYQEYAGKQKAELEKTFEDYKKNAPGFSIEKACKILEEHLSPLSAQEKLALTQN